MGAQVELPSCNSGFHPGPALAHGIMKSALKVAVFFAATGKVFSDGKVCDGEGQEACDAESSDDPSLLSHQIRRVTTSEIGKCDPAPTDHSGGSMRTALKYADIDGHDIDNFKMTDKEQWEKCADACSRKSPICHAWTFHWGDAWCYLKSNPAFCPEGMTDSNGEKGPWKQNIETISGGENIIPLKDGAINNAESGGDPIPELPQGQKGRGMGWIKCQQFCGTYDSCKSWSYVYSTDWCWLKGTNVMEMPWNYTPDVISGLRV